MTKDTLFLLPPAFEDDGQAQLCLESMTIVGILAAFPDVKDALEIRYQPLEKPRPEMTALLGEENQNCPTLLLAGGSDAGPLAKVKTVNGRGFLDNARDIGKYFAHKHGTPVPRRGLSAEMRFDDTD